MKKVSLLLALAAVSSIALADGPRDGTKDLLNAVTLCPSPNNPLDDGLNKLGGNLFEEAVSNDDKNTGAVTITARTIASPHSVNTAIGASDKQTGSITLKVGYKKSGFNNLLTCELTTKKGK
jgi:hypothetical protein